MIGVEADMKQLGLPAVVSVFPNEETLFAEFISWIRLQDPGIVIIRHQLGLWLVKLIDLIRKKILS